MTVQISRRLTLKDIFLLVKSDLAEVETRLDSEIQSAIPLVNDINRYLHTSGGKRLRPAVLLLASKLCGAPTEAALRLSVVVELIHVATLVHDDIIDNSDVRRGRPSVNAKWGNQITVLMGDWLYMTSFQIAMKERSMRILDILIDITRKMVEGELLQLEQEGRMEVTEQQQLEISLYKTAYLFSGCGRLGAILGEHGSGSGGGSCPLTAGPWGWPSNWWTTSLTIPPPRRTWASRSSRTWKRER